MSIPDDVGAVEAAAPKKTKTKRPKKAKPKGWSLYQRPDHEGWCMRWKDPRRAAGRQWGHHRIPLESAKSKQEAELYAPEFVRRQLASVEDGGADTLGAYIERLIARWQRGTKVAESTVADRIGHLRRHVVPRLGSVPLKELKPAHLLDWLAWLRKDARGKRGQPLAPNTQHHIGVTFNSVLADAVDENLIPSNPMGRKIVANERPEAETLASIDGLDPIHVPLSVAYALFTHPKVPAQRRARYVLDVLTGLRDGEVSALTWSDVRIEAAERGDYPPHLTVRRSFNTKRKLVKTKTKAGRREVPLHPVAVDALRAWRDAWVVFFGRRPTGSDPVFANAKGQHSRPRSASNVRRDLEAAGQPKTVKGDEHEHNITFHALRRSCSTWLAHAGVSDRLRTALLGQSQKSVLNKHYTSTSLQELADAVALIRFPEPAGAGPDSGAEVPAGAGPSGGAKVFPFPSREADDVVGFVAELGAGPRQVSLK